MTFALIHLVLAFVAGVGTLPALAWVVFRFDRWRAGRNAVPDEVLAFREAKSAERERQGAARKIVADCERDGGHVAPGGYGKCVGCGTSVNWAS